MSLFDTDVVIEQLNNESYEPGYITIVTLVEVLRGVDEAKRDTAKKLLEESYGLLPLDSDAIMTYCLVYRSLRKDGETLPDADLLIGASAISRKLVLRTGDKHFSRLKAFGLQTT